MHTNVRKYRLHGHIDGPGTWPKLAARLSGKPAAAAAGKRPAAFAGKLARAATAGPAYSAEHVLAWPSVAKRALEARRPCVDSDYSACAACTQGVRSVETTPACRTRRAGRRTTRATEASAERLPVTRPNANSQESPVSGKPSICFVALKAYGLLSGRDDIQHIGGAEVQQTLIARELVKRGYRVSFVVLDHGQPDGEDLDGIRVFKAYRREAGFRGVRFVYPRTTKLWSAMRRADADIYYQRCAGTETGLVARWCRRHRRRFLFAVAADPVCERTFSSLENTRERLLYHYGLRRADCVITQTVAQQRLLSEKFQRDSVVIPSCALDPGDTVHGVPAQNGAPRLIWAGRFLPVKGVDCLLDLAQLCPDYQFDVLGDSNAVSALGDHSANSEYARSVKCRAHEIPNVTLHGWVPHAEMRKHYRNASAVLCTSEFEGFPNTFVEAWSRGLPVISRIDTDHLISERGLGIVFNDVRDLASRMAAFFQSPGEWSACSERARRHFLAHHTVRIITDAYEYLLDWQSRIA